MAAAIEAIAGAGIPLVGHLGMLPQRVVEEGGYRRKGKTESEAGRLLEDARFLDGLGATAIVLESVVAMVAAAITGAVACPTIGIGSGGGTDGQIRVIHDLNGAFPWFRPPFVEAIHDVAGLTRDAASRFVDDVRKERSGR